MNSSEKTRLTEPFGNCVKIHSVINKKILIGLFLEAVFDVVLCSGFFLEDLCVLICISFNLGLTLAGRSLVKEESLHRDFVRFTNDDMD